MIDWWLIDDCVDLLLNCLIDWLSDEWDAWAGWVIDYYLIDWVMYWAIDGWLMIVDVYDCLIDCLVDCFFIRSIDRLMDRSIEWSIGGLMVDWLIGCSIEWLTYRMNPCNDCDMVTLWLWVIEDCSICCVVDLLIGCVIDWFIEVWLIPDGWLFGGWLIDVLLGDLLFGWLLDWWLIAWMIGWWIG